MTCDWVRMERCSDREERCSDREETKFRRRWPSLAEFLTTADRIVRLVLLLVLLRRTLMTNPNLVLER